MQTISSSADKWGYMTSNDPAIPSKYLAFSFTLRLACHRCKSGLQQKHRILVDKSYARAYLNSNHTTTENAQFKHECR